MVRKKRKTKFILISLVVVLVVAAGFIPWPGEVSNFKKSDLATHAANSVLKGKRVWRHGRNTRLHWAKQCDASFVENNGNVYFENDTDIPDKVFTDLGLKPVINFAHIDVDKGDVILRFSYKEHAGEPTENMQFSYIFGSLGAHGLEITVRQSLFSKYYIYEHKSCS